MELERTLARGYLPHEVPVSFASDGFARAVAGLTPYSPGKWTQPVRLSIARTGGLRRQTEIPNPLAYWATVDLCATNWRTLQRLTARSPISVSRPVRRKGERSLGSLHDISRKAHIATTRMIGGSDTLRTDISQFYPSIYTHAVDWAVRGKAKAKRAMRAPVLGRFLDDRLRESRSGQTVGLSIGPDVSWLVSEVLLSKVDAELCRRFPTISKRALRFVDDMTLYARSLGEAHEVLGVYETLLAEYQLLLNPIKVKVLDGLEPPEAPWVSSLRQMRFRDHSDVELTNDMIDLFAKALDFARTFPTDGVLSYAIKRCDPFPGGTDSWPLYRDLVLSMVTQEPSTLRHVYQVLVYAKARSLPINDDQLVEVLNQLCAEHARFDHGYEVAWILTILRELSLPLDPSTANEVALMEDNCSLVMLADMLSRSANLQAVVDLDPAVKRAESVDALSSSDWLLAYEFRAAKWCAPKRWDKILQWREMSKAGVRFLVPLPVSTRRILIRRRRPAFISSWSYT